MALGTVEFPIVVVLTLFSLLNQQTSSRLSARRPAPAVSSHAIHVPTCRERTHKRVIPPIREGFKGSPQKTVEVKPNDSAAAGKESW